MKIGFVSTYLSRECGIATFTRSVYTSMIHPGNKGTRDGFIVALNDPGHEYDYPSDVKFVIREKEVQDYLDAASYINKNADICSIQHEFNIFGGDDGVYLLSLMNNLTVPAITTFHTILKEPSVSQKYIIQEISKMSQKVIAMSNLGIDILTSVYSIPRSKISLIQHGVPDIQLNPAESKEKLSLTGHRPIITFGLINRNKGIETVLRALPLIVKKHPDVRYLILGKTHPVIKRLSGEKYRNYLINLVEKLNLQEFVYFEDRFISESDLKLYLSACDICITPYLNEAQITSGPLSYSIGAGAGTISTPFWHAQELLKNGKGRLFDFKDSGQLFDVLMELFDDPEKLKTLRKKAADYGQKLIWPIIGDEYNLLFDNAVRKYNLIKSSNGHNSPFEIPSVSFKHIKRLTDSTGIIQHSILSFPNYKNGYSLDDNARALLAASMSCKHKNSKKMASLVDTYLSFIQYMQNPDGTFQNHLSYDRTKQDESVSEDCFGRTIWALGYLISNCQVHEYLEAARRILLLAAPNFDKLQSLRGIANTLIGASYYLKVHRTDQVIGEQINILAEKMIQTFKNKKSENWNWFEDSLSYDNAILPLGLLYASEFSQSDELKKVAFESMKFLSSELFTRGHLSIIGNENWFKKGNNKSTFDQQPVDAMSMVLLYKKAYEITHNIRFYTLMKKSLKWFLGENDLRASLYDPDTRGCCDGLQINGPNRNQGAESSLAFVISNMAVKETENLYKQKLKGKKELVAAL